MNYTSNLYKVLQFGRQEAERLGSANISSEHLFLGILRLGEGRACTMLEEAVGDIKVLRQRIEESVCPKTAAAGENLSYDPQAQRILRLLDLEAMSTKADCAGTAHLLLAILKEKNNMPASVLARDYNVSYDTMAQLYVRTSQPRMGLGFAADEDDDDPVTNGRVTTAKPQNGSKTSDTPALDSFGNDLTKSASDGKLDPVIGRNDEIERIVQILSRRKKNNPILIGEPGVGKSAIVEGLALRIVSGQVAPVLLGKRIYTLDLGSMVAGTKYRGQFEERMKTVISELQAHPEIILFIDEIHTIIGAGNQAGQLDVAGMLKPALARGEVQCIGATTLNEYRTSIEKDGALERRFQKILVEPTSPDDTFLILQQLAPAYGKHHHVSYSDEVLRMCVNLSQRYISDRVFPDKAIDVMDEVGAKGQAHAPEQPASLKQLERQLSEIAEQKDKVLSEQNYEMAVALRDKEKQLAMLRDEEIRRWKSGQQDSPYQVQPDDVAAVVSLMSGVPLQRIAKAENVRLRSLADVLMAKVIGQDEAVRTVVRSIQRSRVGLKDPNRPIGTFLFLGPTGVGKTYLAQCLAEEVFGQKDALIRIDMSEYMEKHTVSLLVGAPPGYVGHEDAGKLTEAVRRKPYSIVLFDEIEKAHPDVFNLLLQLLDEGRLTDRQGRVVDFKNTIIIMTSNVGSRQLKDFGRGIGFASGTAPSAEETKSVLQKALDKTFSPEFLNRIDSVVGFEGLSSDSLRKILKLELRNLSLRLQRMGYLLRLDPEVENLLVTKGYDPQFGARPLKRVIMQQIEEPLTDYLLAQDGLALEGDAQEVGKTLLFLLENGKVVVREEKVEE